MLKRPACVIHDVGRDPKLAALAQQTRDLNQIFRADEAALVMPHLWPWVGKQEIECAETSVWQSRQYFARVAHVQTYVRHLLIDDLSNELRGAVDERLAADEAPIGMQLRLRGEMLAAAKANLERKRRRLRKQGAKIDRSLSG